jgi:peptidoglycan/LPS O-acetylase OafA/YrhL
MCYRREVDGVRALAVVPVIFFHGGFSGALSRRQWKLLVTEFQRDRAD